MVAHERRFRVHIIRIKEYLQAGALGDIIHLRIDAIQDKRGQFQRSPWYASAEAGRTALVGTGIHQVDLLRYLMDRPITSVFALSNRMGTLAFPAAKTTSALYQFAGGGIGQVTVTYEAHRKKGGPSDTDFHLVGSKGVVMGDYVTWDARNDWERLPQDERGIVTGTFGCVADFLQAIRQDRPVAVSGREAYASLAACVAADEAAATGISTIPAPADF
jgi:predicted dehydrogenase